MSIIERLHGGYIAGRRARNLATRLAAIMPRNATVLDVGCGDGEIARLLMQFRPDLQISGVDVLVRPDTQIPVDRFDGRTLPHGMDSFDAVMFVDVLHHCEQPLELLREAHRVSRSAIVVKDHLLQGVGAQATLRFMDGVGNRRYGVALPFNYWRPEQWQAAFDELGLAVEQQTSKLNLYPRPFSVLFDRRLHFLARLIKRSMEQAAGGKRLSSPRHYDVAIGTYGPTDVTPADR